MRAESIEMLSTLDPTGLLAYLFDFANLSWIGLLVFLVVYLLTSIIDVAIMIRVRDAQASLVYMIANGVCRYIVIMVLMNYFGLGLNYLQVYALILISAFVIAHIDRKTGFLTRFVADQQGLRALNNRVMNGNFNVPAVAWQPAGPGLRLRPGLALQVGVLAFCLCIVPAMAGDSNAAFLAVLARAHNKLMHALNGNMRTYLQALKGENRSGKKPWVERVRQDVMVDKLPSVDVKLPPAVKQEVLTAFVAVEAKKQQSQLVKKTIGAIAEGRTLTRPEIKTVLHGNLSRKEIKEQVGAQAREVRKSLSELRRADARFQRSIENCRRAKWGLANETHRYKQFLNRGVVEGRKIKTPKPQPRQVNNRFDELTDLNTNLSLAREMYQFQRKPQPNSVHVLSKREYRNALRVLYALEQTHKNLNTETHGFGDVLDDVINGIKVAFGTMSVEWEVMRRAQRKLPPLHKVVGMIINLVTDIYAAVKLDPEARLNFLVGKFIAIVMSTRAGDAFISLCKSVASSLTKLIEGKSDTVKVRADGTLDTETQGDHEAFPVTFVKWIGGLIYPDSDAKMTEMRAKRLSANIGTMNSIGQFWRNFGTFIRESFESVWEFIFGYPFTDDSPAELRSKFIVSQRLMNLWLEKTHDGLELQDAMDVVLASRLVSSSHKIISESSVLSKTWSHWLRTYEKFETLVSRARTTLRQNFTRIQTLCVVFSGASGIGKSTLIRKFVKDLELLMYGSSSPPFSRGVSEHGDRWWDGYNEDTFGVMGEELFSNIEGTRIAAQVEEILQLVSTNQLTLPMAAADQKGKVFFNSPLLTYTTNWDRPPWHVMKEISHPQALLRRIQWMQVALLDDYKNLYDHKTKKWKVEFTADSWKMYRFRTVFAASQEKIVYGEWMTYPEFLKHALGLLRKNYDEFTTRLMDQKNIDALARAKQLGIEVKEPLQPSRAVLKGAADDLIKGLGMDVDPPKVPSLTARLSEKVDEAKKLIPDGIWAFAKETLPERFQSALPKTSPREEPDAAVSSAPAPPEKPQTETQGTSYSRVRNYAVNSINPSKWRQLQSCLETINEQRMSIHHVIGERINLAVRNAVLDLSSLIDEHGWINTDYFYQTIGVPKGYFRNVETSTGIDIAETLFLTQDGYLARPPEVSTPVAGPKYPAWSWVAGIIGCCALVGSAVYLIVRYLYPKEFEVQSGDYEATRGIKSHTIKPMTFKQLQEAAKPQTATQGGDPQLSAILPIVCSAYVQIDVEFFGPVSVTLRGLGFQFCANDFLVSRHQFELLFDSSISIADKLLTRITLKNSDRERSFTLAEIGFSAIAEFDVEGKVYDALRLTVGDRYWPAGRDMIKYMLPEKYYDSRCLGNVVRVKPDPVTRMVVKQPAEPSRWLAKFENNGVEVGDTNTSTSPFGYKYVQTELIEYRLHAEKGDCISFYAIENPKSEAKIFAWHTAGVGNISHAMCIPRERFLLMRSKPSQDVSTVTQGEVLVLKDGEPYQIELDYQFEGQHPPEVPAHARFLGRIPKADARFWNYPPIDTAIEATTLFPDEERTRAPAQLNPANQNAAIVKDGTKDYPGMDPVLKICYEQFANMMMRFAFTTKLKGVLTPLEAINSPINAKFMQNQRVSTSSGHGMREGQSGKHEYMAQAEFGEWAFVPTPMLIKFLNHIVALLDQRIAPLLCFLITYKDELRLLEKVARPRQFWAGNMALLTLLRMYFGAFYEEFMAHPTDLKHTVGMNINGVLAGMIDRALGDIDINCSDIRSNDACIWRDDLYYVWQLKIKFMKAVDLKEMREHSVPKEKWQPELERRERIRRTLMVMMLDPPCVLRDVVYRNDHKNMSGQLFTTEDNCIVDGVRFRAAAMIIAKRKYPADYRKFLADPAYAFEYDSFHFGDDSAGPGFGATFEEYAVVYKEHFGIEITEADKGRSDKDPVQPAFDLFYLSRIPIRINNRIRMVLPKDTIRSIVHWRFRTVVPDSQMYVQLCDAALSEYFLYGREEFESRKKEMDEELIKHGAPVTTLTYSKAYTDWHEALVCD